MKIDASQAIIAKARGMFAKHLDAADYEELLRKRSVTEVAALLKGNLYYRESLAGLSVADPHRGQIEDLLQADLFLKYQKLKRYCAPNDKFSMYFLRESEMREILKTIHLLSIGYPGGYVSQMAGYLQGKISLDLHRLAAVRSFEQLVDVVRNTPYYKVLKTRLAVDPTLRDFPSTEAAVLQSYYAVLFEEIKTSFSGREYESVANLFLCEVEIYNLSLIRRIKAYFPKSYTEAEIKKLIMPYYYKINSRKIDGLINARDFNALLGMYRNLGIDKMIGPIEIEELNATGDKLLYKHANRLLHMTSSPSAALAAFLTLSRLQNDNIISIIEGVRYKMPPEQIRLLLRHI